MILKFSRRRSIDLRLSFAIAAIFVFVAFAPIDADEPANKEVASTTEIETPFDPNTMPTAEKLLAENILGSPDWTAKISITATSPFAPKNGALSGRLVKHNNALSGKLTVAGDADRTVNLSITKQRAIAWKNSGEEDGEKLERLVKGIFLLGMVSPFPDQRKSRSEWIGDFQLANLGITKRNGDSFYVLRAEPKAGASSSGRIFSLPADQMKMTFAISDLQPRRITALSNPGTVFVLEFESISDDADQIPQPPEPPKDAFVIDLSSKPAGDALKNPVAYDADSIKRGKLLYIADCEVCHSVDGTGRDSDVTDNAADLTSTEFWLSDGSETATFLAIRDGAGDEMPGYKDEYRDEKMMWDLVNYIRSLQE